MPFFPTEYASLCRLASSYVLTLLALYLVCATALQFAGSGGTSSNITVACPFYLNITTKNLYLLPSDLNLSYEVRSLPSCRAAALEGNISIIDSAGNMLYNRGVVLDRANASNTVYNLRLSSSSFSPGSYTVTLNLSTPYFSNSTTAPLNVLGPADLLIADASLSPASSLPNTTIVIADNLSNVGGLVATNVVLHLEVSAPGQSPSIFAYALRQIVPGGEELVYATPNITNAFQGNYTVAENLSYQSAFYSNVTSYLSRTVILNYTIHPNPLPTPKVSALPYNSIQAGGLVITSKPLLVSTGAGLYTIAELGLKNTGFTNTAITLSSPSFSGIKTSLSSTSLLIAPSQEQLIELTLNPSSTMAPGIYAVPITITTRPSSGIAAKYSIYVNLAVQNSSQTTPLALKNLILQNLSNELLGQLQVSNPTDAIISNATIHLVLPPSATTEGSHILLYGASSNVSTENSSSKLAWVISRMAPYSQTLLYYDVQDPMNLTAFISPPTALELPLQASAGNLGLYDIDIPVLAVNQTGMVKVAALYTGFSPANISFTLVGSQGINIINSTVSYAAEPNTAQLLSFGLLGISTPGTYPLTLYAYGDGANFSSTLLIRVLGASTGSGGQSTTAKPSVIVSERTIYLLLGILVCLIVVSYAIKRGNVVMRPKRYNKEKVNKLAMVKKMLEND